MFKINNKWSINMLQVSHLLPFITFIILTYNKKGKSASGPKQYSCSHCCVGFWDIVKHKDITIICLVEVIKRYVLYRSKAFLSNPWIAGQWTTQKIQWWVIWESCGVINKRHAGIFACHWVFHVEGTGPINFVVVKEDVIDRITC